MMVEKNNAPRFQIGELFRRFGPAFRQAYPLWTEQRKAMKAIEQCRTPALGGHVERCDCCGYERAFLHSCRNRHCPQCQYLARERWLAARKEDLLPIVYYHTVFTIPDDELNPLALVNKQVVYDILFRAGSETLMQLGRDSKHLGAEIGVTAILHTWAQNLMDHPHLHCIVTGGGLSKDGKEWVLPKKTTEERDFFIHVNILSDLFKKKFIAYLKQAYQSGELKFVGRVSDLQSPEKFHALINRLYDIKWNTYCKESFGGPEGVLNYLGRYTHRVAISNHRIVSVEEDTVSFSWYDRKDHQQKIMTLAVFEFIRRFLLHILPHGFYKIRHYGILSSRSHRTKLQICKKLFNVLTQLPDITAMNWQELLLELTGVDLRICPKCQTGRMVIRIEPFLVGLSPP